MVLNTSLDEYLEYLALAGLFKLCDLLVNTRELSD